jgi:hypothetical protein
MLAKGMTGLEDMVLIAAAEQRTNGFNEAVLIILTHGYTSGINTNEPSLETATRPSCRQVLDAPIYTFSTI